MPSVRPRTLDQGPAVPVSPAGGQAGMGLVVSLGLALGAILWFLGGMVGSSTVMLVLSAATVGTVISYLSWRNTAILVAIWLFTMSGFRAYAMLYMPVLPDISLDRLVFVWLLLLFVVRLLMKRETISGPFTVDLILLFHVLYILGNVSFIGKGVYVHEWLVSSVMPFAGYLVGKNMIARNREVRFLFAAVFVILVYYFIQSIAQKYDLTILIWPKTILDRSLGQWPLGRSRGPFLSPPLFGQMISMFMPVFFFFFFRARGGPCGRWSSRASFCRAWGCSSRTRVARGSPRRSAWWCWASCGRGIAICCCRSGCWWPSRPRSECCGPWIRSCCASG